MHIGEKKKPVTNHSLYQRSQLRAPTYEKYLGLTADSSMKSPARCAAALKKASKMLRCIRNELENKKENIMSLYESIIFPPLE